MIDDVMPLANNHCGQSNCEACNEFRDLCETQCLSDLRAMRDWGNAICQEHEHGLENHPISRILLIPKTVKRRHCDECWQGLAGLIKEGESG